jgi:CcmD family protein
MSDPIARNFEYLAYGLIAIWTILVIYVLTLAGRQRSLNAQVERLRRMVEEREGPAGQPR